jgi:hypothetical protein
MNWLADFLAPIATTGIWVFAVSKIGRYAVDKFEVSIAGSFDRLRRIGSAEFDPTPNKELPQDEAPPTVGIRALPAPATSLEKRYVSQVETWMQQIPVDQREERLKLELAVWQISYHFEFVNSNILGSQLSLLKAANSHPVPVDLVRARYDGFAAANPQLYSNYPYERWLAWLRDAARCVNDSQGLVSITDEGRAFLNYLVTRGYTLERTG